MFTLPMSRRAPRARRYLVRRWWPAACAWLLLCVGVMAAACADQPQTTAPESAAPATVVVTEAAPTPGAAARADAARASEAQDAAEAPPAAEAASETEPAAPAARDWTQFVAVEEDYYLLGNPEAPILILDVSDFL